MADEAGSNVLGLTAQIVVAHVGNNRVAGDTLPALIQSVYRSLTMAGTGEAVSAEAAPRTSAVSVTRSVFPDFIVCLEDGKKLKLLKRHLNARYGMTPEQYRAKWKLPRDYPMVAPNYARTRSALAKSTGFGRKKSDPEVRVLPARRARGSKG